MSWQEDLAELDKTLAEGRIGADEYRRRRDELLASASHSQSQQPQANPFGQPFRWEAGPPDKQHNPEATQVVNNPNPVNPNPANPDATQVVRGGGDAERTQYVRPVPPQPMPPQQQGWQSGPPVNTPPWGNEGYQLGDPNPNWIAQGPEVFDESSGGGRKWLAIVGVVVVLAIVGGGIWFFTSGSGDNNQGGETTQQSTPAPTTTTTRPKDDLEVAELPGNGDDRSAITAFPDVVANKLLTDEENAAYRTAGADKVRLTTSELPNKVYAQILTVETTGAAQATAAVEALAALQVKYGMTPYAGTTPGGVTIHQIAPNGGNLGAIRAHYLHKGTVVRVQVSGTNPTEFGKVFDEVLASQIEALPADE